MGMSATFTRALKFACSADLDHGLREHEVDHVFVAVAAGLAASDASLSRGP
jgi:hypothetical protein